MLLQPTTSPFWSPYLWSKTRLQSQFFSLFNLQHHFPKMTKLKTLHFVRGENIVVKKKDWNESLKKKKKDWNE